MEQRAPAPPVVWQQQKLDEGIHFGGMAAATSLPGGKTLLPSALAASGSDSPRNASAYLFHKKAKLLGLAFERGGAAAKNITVPRKPCAPGLRVPAGASAAPSIIEAPESRKRKHEGANREEVRHVLWPTTQRQFGPGSHAAKEAGTVLRKMNWHTIEIFR